MTEKTVEELESLAGPFFDRASSIKDTRRKKFQAKYRVSKRRVVRVFPDDKWRRLQDDWSLKLINVAMDEVFKSSTVRENFTVPVILKRLEKTGIKIKRFMRLAGDDWRGRSKQLPALREKLLKSIDELVARRIPVEELSGSVIIRNAGLSSSPGRWFWEAVRDARRKLVECQTANNEVVQPPEGVNAMPLAGGWVDVDSDTWDLSTASGSIMKRSLLRGDFADIAWEQMRDALLSKNRAWPTVERHYFGYRCAGELLGGHVPDVGRATLRKVQTAWLKYDAKAGRRKDALAGLRRIFTYLCRPDAGESGVDVKEMLLISAWLYASASVQSDSPERDFLSDAEMTDTIMGCLKDVKSGLDYTESEPDLLDRTTKPRAPDSAAPVLWWTASLMILLMLFTGLRPQSVLELRVGDWAEIRPGLYALIWYHGKKREEKIVVLAASVALLLDQYVKRTARLRQALGTDKVFMAVGRNSYWTLAVAEGYLRSCFSTFVRRHGLKRGSVAINLNGLVLRRTYVTRELYLGRSIWALRLQLGHESLRTTRLYGQFDRFEHAAELGNVLDEYGRRTLTLWRHPLLLADLDPAERDRLLGVKEERHQDVGLCRFDGCRKLSGGSPPPCSMCEHLVTGREFLGAWAAEQKGREEEIERLRSTPDSGQLLTQKKLEYELFQVNLEYVKEKELT